MSKYDVNLIGELPFKEGDIIRIGSIKLAIITKMDHEKQQVHFNWPVNATSVKNIRSHIKTIGFFKLTLPSVVDKVTWKGIIR